MRNGIIVSIIMTRTVYALPKIFKPEVPLRPIVLFISSLFTVYTFAVFADQQPSVTSVVVIWYTKEGCMIMTITVVIWHWLRSTNS